MDLNERQKNTVWLHVFAATMRERSTLPGFASEAVERLPIAARAADDAVRSEDAAVLHWNRMMEGLL